MLLTLVHNEELCYREGSTRVHFHLDFEVTVKQSNTGNPEEPPIIDEEDKNRRAAMLIVDAKNQLRDVGEKSTEGWKIDEIDVKRDPDDAEDDDDSEDSRDEDEDPDTTTRQTPMASRQSTRTSVNQQTTPTVASSTTTKRSSTSHTITTRNASSVPTTPSTSVPMSPSSRPIRSTRSTMTTPLPTSKSTTVILTTPSATGCYITLFTGNCSNLAYLCEGQTANPRPIFCDKGSAISLNFSRSRFPWDKSACSIDVQIPPKRPFIEKNCPRFRQFLRYDCVESRFPPSLPQEDFTYAEACCDEGFYFHNTTNICTACNGIICSQEDDSDDE